MKLPSELLFVESLAITGVLWVLAKGEMSNEEGAMMLATVFGTLFVVDTFVPMLSQQIRQGLGIGIGLKQVGVSFEGYEPNNTNRKNGGGCGCGHR